jgi:TRAP-type mannitol/chloroaromatic compound transport system permease large subunit
VVNTLVFLLAFFLDFFEISFIILPLLAPVAEKLGIDLVWFGILMGVNMQTSFMHPPFGFALFYLRSVAPPTVRTSDIYWGAVPFVVIQVIMVALIIAFPSLVTIGLDRPVYSGESAPVQMLAPQDDQDGAGTDSQPEDTADLFKQVAPKPAQ